jgi:hypothetical protein
MSHFNLKSLAFYGTAIGSVVILFNVVTVYGENNLKAPPSISGRYRLQSDKLSKCPQLGTSILNVRQSGIYVNGSLSPATKLDSAEEKLSLVGKFQPPELNLSGSVSGALVCQSSENQVKIKVSYEKDKLNGQINFDSTQEVIHFTAQREVEEQQKKPEH